MSHRYLVKNSFLASGKFNKILKITNLRSKQKSKLLYLIELFAQILDLTLHSWISRLVSFFLEIENSKTHIILLSFIFWSFDLNLKKLLKKWFTLSKTSILSSVILIANKRSSPESPPKPFCFEKQHSF